MHLLLRRKGKVVGELEQDEDGSVVLTMEEEALAQAALGFLDLQGVDGIPLEGNVLAEECSKDAHRACDLTLATTWAWDFSKEKGIPAPHLEEIAENLTAADEDEVRHALEELVANTPKDQAEVLEEAQGYLTFLWPGGLSQAS